MGAPRGAWRRPRSGTEKGVVHLGAPALRYSRDLSAIPALAKINRDLDRLVQALIEGTPARTVKDRMAQLEARKDVLETQLAQGDDVKVAVHRTWRGSTASESPTYAKRSRRRTARRRRRRSCAP